jgi:maltose alpha-D-glucosyltransferase/alpha-amylase
MPTWLKNAVFYEIYPQSFYDSNADGIGDLKGIIAKLDYIQELGCNALWINPCFESPFHDAGYDVSDYRKIAPRYGTNEDARALFAEAHKRGMHVLFDLVAGHTSIEHEWFTESMKMEQNDYSDRFIWAGTPWEQFKGIDGITGALNGVSERGSCAVNFYSTQPALNYGFAKPDPKLPWQVPVDSPAARATVDAMIEVMRFWLDMGCDGFRVDMAGSLVKGDAEQKETIRLWQGIRKTMNKEYPEAALISEWGDPARALEAGFHMDFLLHFGPSYYLDLFREKPFFSSKDDGDISRFVENYKRIHKKTLNLGYICIPSGNHDMARIARHLNVQELKMAFAFLLSMPGIPFIYYGDELGMKYMENMPSLEGGYERTVARTPMQWDSTLNAGFSSAKPEELYLSIDPDKNRPTVDAQINNSASLWSEVQKLISLRMKYESLQSDAPIEFLHVEPNTNPFVYRRGEGTDAVYIAFNPSKKEHAVTLSSSGNCEVLYSLGKTAIFQNSILKLAGESCVFFRDVHNNA